MRLKVKHRGSFKNTERYLKRHRSDRWLIKLLERHGSEGVNALALATPKDTGEAASSWYYEISKTVSGYKLSFSNSDMAEQVPVVVLLQYGHGTTGGTYVQGRDFINPALKPTIDKLSESIWKEVRYG